MTVQKLKENLYRFSGAKTYQQLAEMNTFLVDEKGKIRSLSEFKRKVEVVHQKYNRNYLEAEYITAKRSAQASKDWKTYEDNQDLFPNLKYMTVDDDKVRHDHEKLHGVIKAVNDSFWDTHYPPNGWRCRCYVKPTTEAVSNKIPTITVEESFNHNVGKSNELFMEKKHPYFVIPKSDKKEVETKINGLLAIHSGKELVKFAKKRLLFKTYKIDGIKEPFEITTTNIKTIIQKPHANRVDRNNLFYDFKNILKNATFIKKLPESKGREIYIEWYYYKVVQDKKTHYLNFVKTKDGRIKLHAITDNIQKKGS